jgi:hypothetical protein
MHKLFHISLALAFTGCIEHAKEPTQQTAEDTVVSTKSVTTPTKPLEHALPEKVIAERLNGTITLLDTVNGKPVARLHDNVLLNTGIPKDGWVMTGIETEITPAQEKSMLLQKGQQLYIQGKVEGELLKDVPLEVINQHKGTSTGLFYGYIPAGRIREGSVIETALSQYLLKHNGRMLPDLQPFIRQFQLKPTGFNEPFIEYANYESTIDDPSPAYRTVLVFYKNKLIAVADSRPATLKGTVEHKLDRGFHGYFFADTDSKLQKEYIQLFNNFINSVD